MKNLPEIPKSWMLMTSLVGLMILRGYGIDSFVTAGLSVVIGWLGHDTFLKSYKP